MNLKILERLLLRRKRVNHVWTLISHVLRRILTEIIMVCGSRELWLKNYRNLAQTLDLTVLPKTHTTTILPAENGIKELL